MNDIAFDAARGLAYISAGSNGMASLSIYNLETRQMVRHPVAGLGTSPLALTPDGTRLFSWSSSNDLTITETSFSSRPHFFDIGRPATGLAMAPNGESIFFVSNDYHAGQQGGDPYTVFALDTDSGRTLWSAVAPSMVMAPVVSPDGATAIMTAPETDELLRVDLPVAPTISAAVDRVAGSDRYATALAISQDAFAAGSVSTVYLATGSNFPDALSAAPAAARAGVPVLLTPPGYLRDDLLAEIRRLGVAEVKIVGGEASVSPDVANALREAGLTVSRIAGVDRYETSRKIVQDAFAEPVEAVYFATGSNFPDALSAAASAGARGVPVLLVPGDALPAGSSSLDQGTRTAIGALRPEQVIVVGGTSTISWEVGWAIDEEASFFETNLKPMRRIWGADRFQTSALISADAFATASRAFIATGYDFPDALAGAAVAGGAGAPLFVVPGSCIPASTLRQLARLDVEEITLLGGPSSLGGGVSGLTRC